MISGRMLRRGPTWGVTNKAAGISCGKWENNSASASTPPSDTPTTIMAKCCIGLLTAGNVVYPPLFLLSKATRPARDGFFVALCGQDLHFPRFFEVREIFERSGTFHGALALCLITGNRLWRRWLRDQLRSRPTSEGSAPCQIAAFLRPWPGSSLSWPRPAMTYDI